MPLITNGGSVIPALLRLAGVAAVQVVEDLLGFLVGDRSAEAILHFLNFLLPHGAVHGRRVARYVFEAVTDVAAARGQLPPGGLLQLNRLLLQLRRGLGLRGRQPPAGTAEGERARGECPPASERSLHATSRLTVCTMLSW